MANYELIINELSEEETNHKLVDLNQSNDLGKRAVFEYLLSLNSPNSKRTMLSFLHLALRQVNLAFESFNWAQLREPLVALVASNMRDHYSPTTINNVLAALKGVAKRLWLNELLSTKEFEKIRAVKAVRGSRLSKGRALASNELHLLFSSLSAEDSLKAHRDAAILALLTECGLRRNECATLLYENICTDPQDPYLTIIGKGNKERICMIPEQAYQLLMVWLADRGDHDGPCFLRIDKYGNTLNEGLTSQRIYSITQDWAKKLGMKRWTPHDLRRTYASTLLELGVDINTVREMMGHANLATTQRYDKRGNQRMRKAANLLKIAN